jgi:hypothetical protein
VAELRPHVDELRGIGIEPNVIGSGTPAEAREFAELMNTGTLPIWSDPALASYRAAGLKRSIGATLGPSTWLKGAKAMLTHRQRRTAGDRWQHGGAMYVRPDDAVTWHFISQAGGDHPPLDQLIAEARRAVERIS